MNKVENGSSNYNDRKVILKENGVLRKIICKEIVINSKTDTIFSCSPRCECNPQCSCVSRQGCRGILY